MVSWRHFSMQCTKGENVLHTKKNKTVTLRSDHWKVVWVAQNFCNLYFWMKKYFLIFVRVSNMLPFFFNILLILCWSVHSHIVIVVILKRNTIKMAINIWPDKRFFMFAWIDGLSCTGYNLSSVWQVCYIDFHPTVFEHTPGGKCMHSGMCFTESFRQIN